LQISLMTHAAEPSATEPELAQALDSADQLTESAAAALLPEAFARLYGEPLTEIPKDLYIPPDALEVILESFEGPLDLLLYLIRRQNFNILDIPMAEVTKQYLRYVEEIRSRNLELAADYLLMAAMLIEIKSRMLLPVRPKDGEEDVDDPRAELVRRLLEYEQMKIAARQIDKFPQLGRDVLVAQVVVDQTMAPRLPDVDPNDLRAAWADILRRAKLTAHHTISRQPLSVREHMSRILKFLQGRPFVEFSELFMEELAHGGGVPIVVVHFLALLELAREGLVEVTQAEAYAPIYVRLGFTAS
jgi:segregation and condensation protein A